MRHLRNFLQSLPPAALSAVCTIAILWLTLAPKPLGDTDLPLFPGADKICHAIMFGGLEWCLLLDRQRRHDWKRPSVTFMICTAVPVALFGWLIEILQSRMQVGRSYDAFDILADALGVVIFLLLYPLLTRFLLK